MIDLRKYQHTSISMLTKSISTGHRAPIVVKPCGSGKTRFAAAVCERAIKKGNRTLFLAPRRGLVFQTVESFEKLGLRSGILMAGVEYDPRHMIEVGSIDTVTGRIGKSDLNNVKMCVESASIIVVDECHGSVSKVRREFLLSVLNGDYGKGKIIIGLTASPCVSGGGGLGAVYDDLVIPVTMRELIADGYLVQPRYFSAPKPDLSNVGMTAGEYKQNELGDAYADITLMGDVLANWIRIAENTITVIFTPTRANAAELVDRFNAAGYRSEYVDANTKDEDRAEMYKRLKSGQTKCIMNVGIISLGVDIPEVQTVVMATATKSIAKWIQAIGRLTRPISGKDFGFVIDHGGMSIDPNMGPVEDIIDWTLDEKEKVQDRILQRKQEKKEPKEISCSACGAVFSARHACPVCGFAMRQPTEALEFYEADLKEIKSEGKKANQTTSWEDKQKFMGEAKGYADMKNYKDGYAAWLYKDKFGVFPNDKRVKYAGAKKPTDLIIGFIKYRAIKKQKSMESS